MNDQYPAEVTNDLYSSQPMKNGDVVQRKDGTLRLYWEPQGDNYTDEEKHDLQGFYDIPTIDDLARMSLMQGETPAGDTVEADHPDAWPRLLGVV